MRHFDLFSGIGGFALAARWAGLETVGFCENDKFCGKVLKKHWPDVPLYDDIREINGEQLKNDGITADIITGGFPCQPFSVAGKQRGENDDRYLWPEMLRIIREMEPTWIIGENVRGLVNMALDEVLADLESAGYSTTAFVIPACAGDAPHRRDRVWIVAHAPGTLLHKARKGNNREGRETVRLGGSSRNVADTNGEGLQRGEEARNNGKNGQELWDEQFAGRSRVEGWDKFPTVAPVCGRDDGVPDRVHRLKALGNAVVPQIPFSLFEMIKEVTNDYQANH